MYHTHRNVSSCPQICSLPPNFPPQKNVSGYVPAAGIIQ